MAGDRFPPTEGYSRGHPGPLHHAPHRNYKGRSYFRIFYRFPEGRKQLEAYLKTVETDGIDWKASAQIGFARVKESLPQFPPGVEVALLQFMMTLDDQLRPVPTPIVESVRLRVFRNVTGEPQPPTNTEVGMNVSEYTLKRRLLFDGLKQGGLVREPDNQPIYRVIFMGDFAPDWGDIKRTLTLTQDCRRCHTGQGRSAYKPSFRWFIRGVDAGAQIGVAHPLPPALPPRAAHGPPTSKPATKPTADSRLPRPIIFLNLLDHPMKLTLTLFSLALLTSTSAFAAEFFVSPQGNDAWSGTSPQRDESKQTGPFATLERARDEIRRLKQAGISRLLSRSRSRAGNIPVRKVLN
ncbi:MAG: hypothetical protein U0903_15775 [Planctomycetales bacterium]